MIPPSFAKTLSVFLLVLPLAHASAALYLRIAPGSGGAVSLTIEGSGVVTGTRDNFLLFGTTGDTFLPNGAPQRYSGLVPSAPVPGMTLGGMSALNNFYRDDSGSPSGLHSIMGFYFGEGVLDGPLDLGDLNGIYHLPESRFSDFIPGTYHGLVSGIGSTQLQGLGDVTLRVVPEPGVPLLAGFGALLAATRRDRRCSGGAVKEEKE